MTRMHKFIKGMYTHIAGFIEPGETVENAVKREVWEESGLNVSNVSIVQTQPWPYPMNLMIGCVAIVDEHSNELDLNHDKELEHAFWCPLKDLEHLLKTGTEDAELNLTTPDKAYSIPNDKTLATKLFQYVVENYH